MARLQHRALLRFLTRRCGSLEEAKDILQEAYVRILRVEHVEAIHALDRYLWRCALNIMKDHGRARRSRDHLAQALSTEDEPLSPSAEATADAQQRLGLLDEAVDRLPPRCVEAFRLRIVRGLPFDDVGREMNISSRMAKVYVSRTLELLQRRLDRSDTDRRAIIRTTAPTSSRIEAPSTSRQSICGQVVPGLTASLAHERRSLGKQLDDSNMNTALARCLRAGQGATNAPPPGDMLMKNADANSVIQALIEGREPGSESLLPADSVVHRADVLRALLTAVAALERAEARVQRRSLLPGNVGQQWTDDEETRMVEAFKAGQSPEDIARKHRRTLRAIEARLQRLGLITAEERITVGGFPGVS